MMIPSHDHHLDQYSSSHPPPYSLDTCHVNSSSGGISMDDSHRHSTPAHSSCAFDMLRMVASTTQDQDRENKEEDYGDDGDKRAQDLLVSMQNHPHLTQYVQR